MVTKLCGELHHERFRGKLGRRQAFQVSDPGFSRPYRRAWIFRSRESPELICERARGVDRMVLQGEKRFLPMTVSLERKMKSLRGFAMGGDGKHSPESSAISSYSYLLSSCLASWTLN